MRFLPPGKQPTMGIPFKQQMIPFNTIDENLYGFLFAIHFANEHVFLELTSKDWFALDAI